MKKFYTTIEEAYKDLLMPLSNYARKHLLRKDDYIDIAHEVFSETTKWFNKSKDRKISTGLMFKKVSEECAKHNKKHSREYSFDFSQVFPNETE